MTVQFRSKVFQAGNSLAVRLPKRLGLSAGMDITVEQDGNKITIAPVEDPAAVRSELQALFEKIDAIWEKSGGPPETSMIRDPDIFPDRPGLYGR